MADRNAAAWTFVRNVRAYRTAWQKHEVDERCPERTVDAGNDPDIRGVVVLVGNTV